MERAKVAFTLILAGGVLFICGMPALVNLVINGPTYDIQYQKVYVLRITPLRAPETITIKRGSPPRILNLSLVQPFGVNYTISGAIWGNSSFSLMLMDDMNYKLYVGGGAYVPLTRVFSQYGENKSFSVKIPEPIILYMILEGGTQSTLSVTFKMDHKYYIAENRPVQILNTFWTAIIPAASVGGLLLMVIGLFVLRSEARAILAETIEQSYVPTEQ